MNHTELRCNNLILCKSGKNESSEFVVTPEIILDVSLGNIVFPIPPTEKFFKERFGMNVGISGRKVKEVFSITKMFYPNGSWIFCYKDVKILFDSIHKFQNIYYFIFGKELLVKPKNFED